MKKLLLSVIVFGSLATTQAQNCSELIISKYMRGKGNTKAVEFYNPTSSPINLTAGLYSIERYKSVSATGAIDNIMDDSVYLVGTVAPFSTWVLCNGQTAANSSPSSPEPDTVMKNLANQLDKQYGTYGSNVGQPMYFKGNDCLVLRKNGNIIDVFGEVNCTVTYWSSKTPYRGGSGSGTWVTTGYILERKASVKAGRVPPAATPNDLTTLADVSSSVGFNTLAEYDTIPKLLSNASRQDTVDAYGLFGSHTCDCYQIWLGTQKFDAAKNANIFPNPANNVAYISANEKIRVVEIYNIQGVKVETIRANSNMITINSEAYIKGIYFIKTLTESGKTLSNKVVFN